MTLTADPTPENEPETPREAETRHLAEAERLLGILDGNRSPVHADLLTAMGARATAHATLALYYRDVQADITTHTTEKKD